MLVGLHAPLALLTFAGAIPVLILCHRFQQRYMVIVRRIQDQTGDLTTTIEEGAKGIRVLKAFGRGDVAFAKYQAEAQEIHDTQMERIRLHTRFVWVLALIPNLTLVHRAARRRAGRRLRRPDASAAWWPSCPTC